ncbi:Hypothetical protein NTJ_05984 [Nesidiocoris tenuis]|uniref:Uncharacterized protein n=1 Tax=Nesidiocoris tenuis TaxID=355587 RepID=A0ABN7ALR9_9HEMI|nr:Hypothetical protein NTJ_05984 [Nesidiocoris tenuis]
MKTNSVTNKVALSNEVRSPGRMRSGVKSERGELQPPAFRSEFRRMEKLRNFIHTCEPGKVRGEKRGQGDQSRQEKRRKSEP